MPEIARLSSHQMVAEAIRRWLGLGSLAPGDRLPSERELANQFGVGRRTIREAVQRLAEEGLVRTTRGRTGGTFVLDDGKLTRGSSEMTHELLRELRENFEFRLVIEPMAANLAAARAGADEGEILMRLADQKATSARVFRALDSRFHAAVATYSGNDLLANAVQQSRMEFFGWADATWRQVDWSTTPIAQRDFRAKHTPIAQAIVDGDGDHAATLMRQHIEGGREQYVEIITNAIAVPSSAA
jgi:DNA-binding FadR family transcriptional regulator